MKLCTSYFNNKSIICAVIIIHLFSFQMENWRSNPSVSKEPNQKTYILWESFCKEFWPLHKGNVVSQFHSTCSSYFEITSLNNHVSGIMWRNTVLTCRFKQSIQILVSTENWVSSHWGHCSSTHTQESLLKWWTRVWCLDVVIIHRFSWCVTVMKEKNHNSLKYASFALSALWDLFPNSLHADVSWQLTFTPWGIDGG